MNEILHTMKYKDKEDFAKIYLNISKLLEEVEVSKGYKDGLVTNQDSSIVLHNDRIYMAYIDPDDFNLGKFTVEDVLGITIYVEPITFSKDAVGEVSIQKLSHSDYMIVFSQGTEEPTGMVVIVDSNGNILSEATSFTKPYGCEFIKTVRTNDGNVSVFYKESDMFSSNILMMATLSSRGEIVMEPKALNTLNLKEYGIEEINNI